MARLTKMVIEKIQPEARDVFRWDDTRSGGGHLLVRAVPEPSTASLLALGLIGLAAKRRRSN